MPRNVPSALLTLSHLNLTTTSPDRYCYYHRFTDEGTEAGTKKPMGGGARMHVQAV